MRQILRIAGALIVLAVMAAALRDITKTSDSPTVATRDPSTPSPSAPAPSRDPSAPLLAGLVVADADVTPQLSVAGLQGGNGLTQPTLDLCNGTYPSETQRSARLQVAAVDSQGQTQLSTEAVLYTSAAGTTAAFGQLESTAKSCPAGPVDSPVGEPTVTTKFNPPPDGAWPQTPTVERLAFSFETTSADTGETNRSLAVFLRRGRALVGLYFSNPDSSTITVAGRSTIPDIVTLFANRLAKLPVSAVSTTA